MNRVAGFKVSATSQSAFAMSGLVRDASRQQAGRWWVLPLFGLLVHSGCSVSQETIERRHWELNDSIRRTSSEQLLLNIVRLRYDEMPYFLQVSNVSTQFSAQRSGNASGTLTDGAPGVLGLGGSVSYSESPVVTWSLPDSRDYLGRLMAPMGADQLAVLAQSGWGADRVMRVGVRKVNRLRNLTYEFSEGVRTPETYPAFQEVMQLIQELRREDLVDLAYGVNTSSGGATIPAEKFDARAIPPGLAQGLQFMSRDDPSVILPLKTSKPLCLRFSKQSDDDPRAIRIRELLDLDRGRYSFGILDTLSSGREQLLSESGRLTQAFDPDADFTEIVLNNRSMLEVLRFASTYVQPPEAHLAQGLVREVGAVAANWLRIAVSSREPGDAWLKVEFRGHWFYVAGDDVESRQTFSLLEALFASVVGNVPGAKPLLTQPVR